MWLNYQCCYMWHSYSQTLVFWQTAWGYVTGAMSLVEHKPQVKCSNKPGHHAVTFRVPHSLIFVQNTEGVQEGKVGSDALKVLLRNIAVMVMVIIPEHRLPSDKKEILCNTSHTPLHMFNQKLFFCIL